MRLDDADRKLQARAFTRDFPVWLSIAMEPSTLCDRLTHVTTITQKDRHAADRLPSQ
jgi:hypothetical protein